MSNQTTEIISFEDPHWAVESAGVLNRYVENVCAEKGSCSILLTGGRGAQCVYNEWRNFLSSHKIDFYFGDERCVPLSDPESNYRLVMESLLSDEPTEKITIYPIQGDAVHKEEEAKRYAALLPDTIDILLLSIGEDAHIASLFPQSEILLEKERKVMPATGTKKPFSRFTITPVVIRAAGRIFCFGQGPAKGKALALIFNGQNDFLSVPAKLALHGTWLLDHSAENAMNHAS